MSRLAQAVDARLGDILAVYQSGVTELTGRARKLGSGPRSEMEYGPRFRGGFTSHAFPELERTGDTPGAIAKAIERGKGKVYQRVRRVVADDLSEYFPAPARKRKPERPSVAPHESLSKRCSRCGVPHGRGAHRFHGRGSWLRTHLFPFKVNPMEWTVKKAQQAVTYYTGLARYVALTKQERALLSSARQFLRMVRRRRNPRRNPASDRCPVKGCPAKRSVPHKHSPSGLPIFHKHYHPSGRKRNPPRRTRIYGRLLRIEAKKEGKHRCDAACRRANHSYFHDFGPGAVVYGNPDGTLSVSSQRGKRLWKWF